MVWFRCRGCAKLWYNAHYEAVAQLQDQPVLPSDQPHFVERLWRVATFSCVEVLAYCFMSNHFHILVYVPDPRELSDDELLARIRALYSGTAELRAALGIASANFFTARYLTPLAKSGYIAVAGGEKNRYLPGKQYRILRKGKAVICA